MLRFTFILAVTLASLNAGETRLSIETSDGRPAQMVLGALLALETHLGDLHTDLLLAGRGDTPVTLALTNASTASARQALAHAMGTWWFANRAGAVVFIVSPGVPLGLCESRIRTSTLIGAEWSVAVVEQLLAPWMANDAGLSYDAVEGSWSTTLDAEGHVRLHEILEILEKSVPRAPSLVPDADQPDPDLSIPALRAAHWPVLVRQCVAAGLNISLSPRLRQEELPGGRIDIPAGNLGDLPRRLARVGIQAGLIRGVLCLASLSETIEDREHPALRRRLAVLPIGHLMNNSAEGLALATILREHVANWWWSRPGAGLWYLDRAGALLVAADAPTIHAVNTALALIDRRGLKAGLERLGAGRP